MASIATYIKDKAVKANFNEQYKKGKDNGFYSNLSDFNNLVGKNIDVLNAMAEIDQKAKITDDKTLAEKLNFIVEKSTLSKSQIIADAIVKRVNYLYNEAVKTMENKSDILENLEEGTPKSKRFGSAKLRLESYIDEIKAYNKSVSEKKRVYISTGSISKNIDTWMLDRYNVQTDSGLKGIRVNASTLKQYFKENEEDIVKHNVGIGHKHFEESIRYLSDKEQKARFIKIAKQHGYKG